MSLFAPRRRVRIPEVTGEPTLTHPVSQVCTERQFQESAYRYWCQEFHEWPRTHRKQWEFCFVLQALATRGMLTPGYRGLGFGVGEEPLAALLAYRGVAVLATDLDPARAAEVGWTETAEHARALADLNRRGLCRQDRFDELVSFQVADMNAIPPTFRGFDFVWSACALEHLGSIRKGAEFILNALDTLRPGGVAVHTTEFNVNNDAPTLDDEGTVLFRRQDLEPVFEAALRRGCRCSVNWDTGSGELDKYIDTAPYSPDRHLKLLLEPYVTTSIGLIFEAPL